MCLCTSGHVASEGDGGGGGGDRHTGGSGAVGGVRDILGRLPARAEFLRHA